VPAPVISIIDDDEAVRDATEDLLRSMGYSTATFASADDYLRSEKLRDTACVITDMQMPGLSGIELQDQLVADGHNTPMIFVTAFPNERVRTRVLSAGAYGFLSKPLEETQLIECLKRALER